MFASFICSIAFLIDLRFVFAVYDCGLLANGWGVVGSGFGVGFLTLLVAIWVCDFAFWWFGASGFGGLAGFVVSGLLWYSARCSWR